MCSADEIPPLIKASVPVPIGVPSMSIASA